MCISEAGVAHLFPSSAASVYLTDTCNASDGIRTIDVTTTVPTGATVREVGSDVDARSTSVDYTNGIVHAATVLRLDDILLLASPRTTTCAQIDDASAGIVEVVVIHSTNEFGGITRDRCLSVIERICRSTLCIESTTDPTPAKVVAVIVRCARCAVVTAEKIWRAGAGKGRRLTVNVISGPGTGLSGHITWSSRALGYTLYSMKRGDCD